ncbi:hypothetical protein BGZ95_011660 [Linnemannia exigua]|uniref:Uncharacterized protein n=1 Tax=Linnemannia exigua TaxID=604196 RepID=A0AAD4DJS2_9FUNG|nr:hypothetical protein BGZ95_011660 [Linnemannia exigua]
MFESTLPIYTHSPIPEPVVFYSPTRSDATPAAPAIRLHPSTAATPSPPRAAATGGRARFAEDTTTAAGTGSADTNDNSTQAAIHNNVTFQTRPRGNTADSTSSFAYPTFAAYRQAQHVNFDAFAQRVKRAFALSQQQRQEQQREMEEQELKKQQLAEQKPLNEQSELKQQQPLSLDQQRPTNSRSNSASAVPSSTLSTFNNPPGTRSRSSSAASMIGDFAERLKAGKLFRRSSNLSLRATVAANAASSDAGTGTGAGVSRSSLSKRPSNQQLNISGSNNGSDPELLSAPLAPSGIEIMVTPSEDDHPSTDKDNSNNNHSSNVLPASVLSSSVAAPATTAASGSTTTSF